MLPEPGTYAATTPVGTVYETEGGALMAAFDFTIDAERSIVAYMCLASKAGELQQNTVKNLREAFGWPGSDPFWLCDNDLSGCQVQIVVEMEPDRQGNPTPRVKWINAPGGGALPQAGDRNAIAAKYGAKFRAIAGGTHVAPAASPKPPAPKPVPAATMPPFAAAPCTIQDAWAEFCNQAGSAWSEAALGKVWYEHIAAVTGGKGQAECTGEDWGRVKASAKGFLENRIPF